MKSKTMICAVTLSLISLGGVALASIEPGVYEFKFDSNATWFDFASGDSISSGSTPDAWYAESDASGNLSFFEELTDNTHATSHQITPCRLFCGPEPIQFQFVVDDITGTWNPATTSGNWTITAHLAFSANAVFTASSCETSQFEVAFDGNYWAGAWSTTFTVPSLSGSGSQACAGWSSTINSDFDLGSSGAKVDFGKFNIMYVPS